MSNGLKKSLKYSKIVEETTMKLKKFAAVTAALTVFAALPVTGVTAMAEESNVSVVRSLDGKTFDAENSKSDRRDLNQVPDNSKSYTYKIDITGSIPAEGYKADLRTLLFYDEEYTCDITWTCGGKLQYELPNKMLFMVSDESCDGDRHWGMGGGGEEALEPSDCTNKSYSFNGDIVLEEGNYDHSSEQYQAYLAEYNSEWYQSAIKMFEEGMTSEDPDYREYSRVQYESFKELREYPYSWYKLGSDKKSVTLELGTAPDPNVDNYGFRRPELTHPMMTEEMVEQTKSKTKLVVSDGPYFNFTVTTPGTIELTFKAKDGNTNPGDSSKPNSNSDDKKTAITNKNASVSVNGTFPEGTKLNADVKKNDNGSYTYSITPVDANGNKVQPDGAAVVMVPLPAEYKDKTVHVYRVEDGKYVGLNSWIDGDWLFFTTTHFSEFEITTETRAEANPNTGSPAAMLGVVALAGAFAIVSRKKR